MLQQQRYTGHVQRSYIHVFCDQTNQVGYTNKVKVVEHTTPRQNTTSHIHCRRHAQTVRMESLLPSIIPTSPLWYL